MNNEQLLVVAKANFAHRFGKPFDEANNEVQESFIKSVSEWLKEPSRIFFVVYQLKIDGRSEVFRSNSLEKAKQWIDTTFTKNAEFDADKLIKYEGEADPGRRLSKRQFQIEETYVSTFETLLNPFDD